MLKVIHTLPDGNSARSFLRPLIDVQRTIHSTEVWSEGDKLRFDASANPFGWTIRIIRFIWRLWRANPSVLHAHQTKGATIPLLSGYALRTPIRIYHNHGMPFLGYHGIVRSMLKVLEIINTGAATHALTVSRDNLLRARAEGLVCSDRYRVLGHGSICGYEPPDNAPRDAETGQTLRRKFNLDRADCVFLYVGRPVRRKGYFAVLDAWQRAGRTLPRAELWVAGVGQKEAASAGGRLVERVRWLGYVEDMHSVYAAADVVVLPSFHEGLPYALLEGAFHGRALIGTDAPGVTELVIDGETGLMVPVNDAVLLADAMKKLGDDEALRNQLGSSARRYVSGRFARSDVIASFNRFYDELQSRLTQDEKALVI